MLSIPRDAPPGELASLARIVLIEWSFDAPVVRQTQLTPAPVIKIGASIRDVLAWISCWRVRSRCARTQDKFAARGGHPIFNLLICQLAFCSRRVAFLKPPVSVDRDTLAQRNSRAGN